VSNAIIVDDTIRAHQESKQEKGFDSPIWECYSQVPDDLCSTTPPTLAASSPVGHLSTATLERHTESYGTPTDRVAPTTIEDGRSAPHMLQLWSIWSHHSRQYYTKAEFCSSFTEPLQPASSWSNKGRSYKNWSCELHNYRGYPRGWASPHGHIFLELTPNCYSIRFERLSWLHQQGVHPKALVGHWVHLIWFWLLEGTLLPSN
jgi:hypothetical protein